MFMLESWLRLQFSDSAYLGGSSWSSELIPVFYCPPEAESGHATTKTLAKTKTVLVKRTLDGK